MRMRYVLDFDRTLFDTERSYVRFEERGLVAGDPAAWEVLDSAEFLYPDTRQFLERTRGVHPMAVLTFADTETYGPANSVFQRTAVERAVGQYVDEIVCTEDPDKSKHVSLFRSGEPVVFLDDTPAMLECVAAAHPHVLCVHVRRPETKHYDTETSFVTVSSLDDIEAVLSAHLV